MIGLSATEGGGRILSQAERMAVERILQKRFVTSYRNLQKDLPFPSRRRLLSITENPVINLQDEKALLPEIYEEKPFFSFLSVKDRLAYVAAEQNRQVNLLVSQRDQLKEALLKNREELLEAGIQPKSGEPPAVQMLNFVPQGANLIFLGETHNILSVQKNIQLFLREYRAKNPQKEVILVSEFFPSGSSLDQQKAIWKEMTPQYGEIYREALAQNMHIEGIEHPLNPMDEEPLLFTVIHPDYLMPVELNYWASLEGVKQRNQHMFKRIQEIRQEHPNAVLIMHMGSYHVTYNTPFSLSTRFPQKEVFVGVFSSKQGPKDLLTRFGGAQFGKIPVLHWQDPYLFRMAGFNARVRAD